MSGDWLGLCLTLTETSSESPLLNELFTSLGGHFGMDAGPEEFMSAHHKQSSPHPFYHKVWWGKSAHRPTTNANLVNRRYIDLGLCTRGPNLLSLLAKNLSVNPQFVCRLNTVFFARVLVQWWRPHGGTGQRVRYPTNLTSQLPWQHTNSPSSSCPWTCPPHAIHHQDARLKPEPPSRSNDTSTRSNYTSTRSNDVFTRSNEWCIHKVTCIHKVKLYIHKVKWCIHKVKCCIHNVKWRIQSNYTSTRSNVVFTRSNDASRIKLYIHKIKLYIHKVKWCIHKVNLIAWQNIHALFRCVTWL